MAVNELGMIYNIQGEVSSSSLQSAEMKRSMPQLRSYTPRCAATRRQRSEWPVPTARRS